MYREHIHMENNSKELVHKLYNSLAQSNLADVEDLKEVLLKIYPKLDSNKENSILINRLTNFIYFRALTDKIKFNVEQQEFINQLNNIGGKAGVNNAYRSPLGSKYSF